MAITMEMALSPRQPFNGQRVRRIPGCFNVSTWNVQSMYEGGKTHNIIREMTRLNVQIMGISETWWPNTGQLTIQNHEVYYSGNNDPKHRNGVGIIVTQEIKKCVKSFIPRSDRMLLLQLHSTPVNVNIIQVYAPTAEKSDELIEEFYDQLKDLMKLVKNNEVTIIMGDFNAKVGNESEDEIVGRYGLGTRNERGDRMVQFCREHKLAICNTFFQLPPRRLYTWKSPADSAEHIIRNQIDYITIQTRFQNAIKSVKAYPGADVASDHNPLVCKLQVKLKKVGRHTTNHRTDITKLQDDETRALVANTLKTKITDITSSSDDPMEKWNKAKQAIENTCKEQLKATYRKKKDWMTEEILQQMDIRRNYKSKDPEKYRQTNRTIKRMIKEAKERWLCGKCKEIEEFEQKYDYHNMHKEIKHMTTQKSKPLQHIIDGGKIITETSQLLKVWESYIKTLFHDERPEISAEDNEEPSGPPITKDEIKKAISSMKNNRAPGPDGIHGELLKLMCETNSQFIDMILPLFNNIYDCGKLPEEWTNSLFITIPKKPHAKSCDQYRLISLINTITKVFTKVIHNRIYTKCESKVAETQFGFRGGFGTREAVFSLQVLIQRCRDMSRDVFVCFIDFSKAFDNVKHEKLLKLLKDTGIDSKDIRIIANLYWNQSAKIRINGDLSENIQIKKGVRQGCVMSPTLFNIYSEAIFDEVLYDATEGIMMNGELINNIRYADDTAIIASSLKDLQNLLQRISEVSENYGLQLNTSKTKWMLISKNRTPVGNLLLNQTPIEHVDKFTYLGTIVHNEWNMTTEIRSRIEKARANFIKMKHIFTSKDISQPLKIRLIKCYVFPVLLYGVEAWTLTGQLMKKLSAFEMWIYRRILRISWTDHITNNQVLERMGKEQEVVITVKKRKLEYFGHLMRHNKYRLQQLILQGKVDGRRGPGRRRNSWLQNLREWFGLTSIQLFRQAANKIRIAMLIANVRNG